MIETIWQSCIIAVTILSIETQSDGPIFIYNGGFEDDVPINDDTYKYGGAYTFNIGGSNPQRNWNWNDPHTIGMIDNSAFVANPSAGTSFINGGGAQEGDIVIFLQNFDYGKDGDGEFGVSTQWSNNWLNADSVIGGKTYTLKVWVGNPAINTWSTSSTGFGGTYNLNGWPGYRIELVFSGGAGDHVVARDDNTLTIADGYWAVSTVYYNVPDANPCVDIDGVSWNCIGMDMKINLYNSNDYQVAGDGVFNYANTVCYDDVRLEVSPAPTKSPTKTPTLMPTISPSLSPTDSPTVSPTKYPSISPTEYPSVSPSISPTLSPSFHPTLSPTKNPTVSPTRFPTISPTLSPSALPTNSPSFAPSNNPTISPSISPSAFPTVNPTLSPSASPTQVPTGIDPAIQFANFTGVSLAVSYSNANGQSDNICNAGTVTLELSIYSQTIYAPNCEWNVFMDDVVFSAIEVSNIALSPSNECFFKMNGAKMQSDATYNFEACVVIDGDEYCDDEIVQSLPVPIIESFEILPNENSVYLWDTSNTIGINVNLITFGDNDTVYTVHSDELSLSTGNRTKLMDQSIVVVGDPVNGFINLTVCGLDTNQCYSCFTKSVSVSHNEEIVDDLCALNDVANEISEYAAIQNNLHLQLTAAILCVDTVEQIDLGNDCFHECQQNGYGVISQILSTEDQSHSVTVYGIIVFKKILQNVYLSTIDQTTQTIQNVIYSVSQKVNSVEQANNILCLNSLLIAMIPDQTDERCDIAQKTMQMTEEMTIKLVQENNVKYDEIYLESSCIQTGVVDVSGRGVIIDTISSNASSGIVSFDSTNNSQSVQLNFVFLSGSIAQYCVERKGNFSMDASFANEYILSDDFVNITIVNQTFEFKECCIHLPNTDSFDTLLFVDETHSNYSNVGIMRADTQTFISSHFTMFVLANFIVTGKNNQIEHIIVSSLAILWFLTMIVFIFCYAQQRMNSAAFISDKMISNKLLLCIFIILSLCIIHEIVLIAYYSLDTSQNESFENFITFCILLPSIIHFWVFMIALFSWLKIFYGSSLSKTQKDMQKLRDLFTLSTVNFSIVIFIVSVFIASVNHKEAVTQMANICLLTVSVIVFGIGIISKILMNKLIKQYKQKTIAAKAKYNQQIVKKLVLSSNMITVCFVVYTFITVFEVCNEANYLKVDYLMELVIKMSDLTMIAVVFYLYQRSLANWTGTRSGSASRHEHIRLEVSNVFEEDVEMNEITEGQLKDEKNRPSYDTLI